MFQRLLFIVLLVFGSAAGAADGLVTVKSAHKVSQTMDRLEAAVRDAGLVVFTRG